MSHYTHLAQEERYQIHALMKAGHRQAEIAILLGRHPSTVGRELARNWGGRGYRPQQAHALALSRAHAARIRPRITARQWAAVSALIRRDWSPEQIADRARLEGTLAISHETIYPIPLRREALGRSTVAPPARPAALPQALRLGP